MRIPLDDSDGKTEKNGPLSVHFYEKRRFTGVDSNGLGLPYSIYSTSS